MNYNLIVQCTFAFQLSSYSVSAATLCAARKFVGNCWRRTRSIQITSCWKCTTIARRTAEHWLGIVRGESRTGSFVVSNIRLISMWTRSNLANIYFTSIKLCGEYSMRLLRFKSVPLQWLRFVFRMALKWKMLSNAWWTGMRLLLMLIVIYFSGFEQQLSVIFKHFFFIFFVYIFFLFLQSICMAQTFRGNLERYRCYERNHFPHWNHELECNTSKSRFSVASTLWSTKSYG